MKISPARKIAFDVLRRVEAEGAYASDLLHARLAREGKGAPELRSEDAALATELTLGTLRWQRLLDSLLAHQMDKPVEGLDVEVRVALRLGLYQLRFLERVPAHAAVSQSVELVKWARKRSAAGLVNAVLRRAASRAVGTAGGLVASTEQGPANLMPAKDEADSWGILFSHPTWLVRRWRARFGDLHALDLLRANNHAARQTVVAHDEALRSRAADSLRAAGLTLEPSKALPGAWSVRGGSAAATEAFRRGWISIHDEASQMIPLLLDVQPGQRVLDLCAAPGGKTVALAQAAGAQGRVVACDLHEHRLRSLRENLARVGVSNVETVALDGTIPLPFSGFDRVLVDAPCSGTGTLARNPEIRWRLKPEDLPELHARQVALVSHALDALAPGGRLVYATCSLEPEENEQVVSEIFRRRQDVHQVNGRPTLERHLAAGADVAQWFDFHGFFRTFPPEHGTDGFVAAVLEKR